MRANPVCCSFYRIPPIAPQGLFTARRGAAPRPKVSYAEPTVNRRHPYRPRGRRSTPAGEHRPVLLADVLAALDPKPGQVVVDCTAGWAGHAAELLRRAGPAGRLVALDLDP